MKIHNIQIKNFKSFRDVTVELDPDFNVFTGVNNSGKTNLLEAITLWHECFNFLIYQASRASVDRYQAGDYVFKNNQYILYTDLKTVRSSSINDLFYQCDTSQRIELILTFEFTEATPEADLTFSIGFSIANSHGNSYKLEFLNRQEFDFFQFNQIFHNLPKAIVCSFASSVAIIRADERFLTTPQILEAIQKRESVEVIRNRLYTLHNDQADPQLYERFKRDLSYILFDSSGLKINFFTSSDFRNDIKVIINYKIDNRDVEKDISLLGSGTLQIMVILLNLYPLEQTGDLNLILFDEPDSHIHRDIQKRLIDTLLRFSRTTQVFLTTHNESLIRQVPLHQIFHLENRAEYCYTPLSKQALSQGLEPRFKGIYPSVLNPVISSLGNSNGLDFVNAIEADKIIFVEGQDDASAVYILLQKSVLGVNTKKYAFWVLGGISRIFEDLPSYKKVFQMIKNEQTLWDKSALIFDRDFLNDTHRENIARNLAQNFKLPTYIPGAYTFESILLTDLEKFGRLLSVWLRGLDNPISVDPVGLAQSLEERYRTIMGAKLESWLGNDQKIEKTIYEYRSVRDKLKREEMLGKKDASIAENDVQLSSVYRNYLTQVIGTGEFYKCAGKEDVEEIVNQALNAGNLDFRIERDFLTVLSCVDRSTWFNEWDFLTRL